MPLPRTSLLFVLLLSSSNLWTLPVWSCEPASQQIVRDALTLQGRGKLDEAERLLRDLEASLKSARLISGSCLAAVQNNLGSINQDLGRYDRAERYYANALQSEQHHGAPAADTTITLNNLGSLYFETGQYRKAAAVRQKALDLAVASFGPKHPVVARILQNIAAQQHRQGQIADAEELYDRALSIWRNQRSENTADFATAIHGAGLIQAATGNLDTGIQHIQQALDIWARSSLAGPAQAKAEANLAVLLQAEGEVEAAQRHWHSSISTVEKSTGPASAVTRELLSGYLAFLRKTRQSYEAKIVKARLKELDKIWGDRHIQSSIVDVTQLARKTRLKQH